MKTYESCREAFPVFYYRSCTFEDTPDTLVVTYHFEVPGLSSFEPEWRFPKKDAAPADPSGNRTLRSMLFGLGMVELISYWKIACPPRVVVSAGTLTEGQIRWWKDLYYLGLGEFFHTNRIAADPDTFMEITCGCDGDEGMEMPSGAKDGCLIPVGGGKDSACTI